MKRFTAILLILAVSIGMGYLAQTLESEKTLKAHPQKYTELVDKYSAEYEIPVDLLYSVIKCESNFDSNAKSSAGACGLMQLMPKTLEDMMRRCGESYKEELIFDPETNIKYGSYYMHYLYNIFNDWDMVLAAYNGGMGNVKKWMQDSEYYDGAKIIKYPKGFDETENYVKRVNEARKAYNELYYREKKK